MQVDLSTKSTEVKTFLEVFKDADSLIPVEPVFNETYKDLLPDEIFYSVALRSDHEHIFSQTVEILLSAFGIVSNVFIIVVNMLIPSLRSVNANIFVVSLSVSDLLVSGVVMVFSILLNIGILSAKEGSLTKQGCYLWASVSMAACTASSLNICAISLDRYVLITRPLHYDAYMTKCRIQSVLAIIWCCSFLAAFITLRISFGSMDDAGEEEKHESNVDHSHLNFTDNIPLNASYATFVYNCNQLPSRIYIIFIVILVVFLPCLVVIFVYLVIFQLVIKQTKFIKKETEIAKRLRDSEITKAQHGYTLLAVQNSSLSNAQTSSSNENEEIKQSKQQNTNSQEKDKNSAEKTMYHDKKQETCQDVKPANNNDASLEPHVSPVSANSATEPVANILSTFTKFMKVHFKRNNLHEKRGQAGSSFEKDSSLRDRTECHNNLRDQTEGCTNTQDPTDGNYFFRDRLNSKKNFRKRMDDNKMLHERTGDRTLCPSKGKEPRAKTQSTKYISSPIDKACMTNAEGKEQRKYNVSIVLANLGNRLFVATKPELKAALLLMFIAGTYVICWLPFGIFSIVEAYKPDMVSSKVREMLLWLAYSNSCWNPLVYALLNRSFREAIYKSLQKRNRMRERESVFLSESPFINTNQLNSQEITVQYVSVEYTPHMSIDSSTEV